MKAFGGVDVLVNNAGAISLTNVESTSLKRYDLMQDVNARAVFLCSQAALPYLKQADHAHILSLSPPLNMDVKWLAGHAPYTLSKYGMTMLSLGMAAEFKGVGVAVNCLWPKTIIATAAIEFAIGSRALFDQCRKPEITADAACEIILGTETGQTFLDEEVLREAGVEDFKGYAVNPDADQGLYPDLFL